MPHLEFTLSLALLISVMIAVTGAQTLRERLYHATYLLTTSMAAVVVGGWLMFFIER